MARPVELVHGVDSQTSMEARRSGQILLLSSGTIEESASGMSSGCEIEGDRVIPIGYQAPGSFELLLSALSPA